MLQFWNLFNARCLGLAHSALHGLFENKGFVAIASSILIGQILIVQFGGKIFRTVPLSLRDWALIIAGTSLVLWIGEISGGSDGRNWRKTRLRQAEILPASAFTKQRLDFNTG